MRQSTIIIRPHQILTSADKIRLWAIAPSFGIEFRKLNEDAYFLRSLEVDANLDVTLPSSTAHIRLLTEISSRAAPWIYFRLDESCRDSLLNNSDARLMRVADLYLRSREAKQHRPVDRSLEPAIQGLHSAHRNRL